MNSDSKQMKSGIEFGVGLPTFCGGQWGEYVARKELEDFCRTVEKMGYDSIWCPERLVTAPPLYNTSWYEPLITLSVLSTVTNLKIGTSVLILPLRNPATVAKQIATLDVLTGGRLILGVGIGWNQKEFEVCGVKMEERAERFEEMLKIIKTLWKEGKASFKGKYWSFEDIELEPKPLQKPHPPILIGGGMKTYDKPAKLDKILKRAVTLGDGWIGFTGTTIEQLKTTISILRKHLKELKREDEKFIICQQKWTYIYETGAESMAKKDVAKVLGIDFDKAKNLQLISEKKEFKEKVKKFLSAGITHFNILPLKIDYELLEFFASEIVPDYK